MVINRPRTGMDKKAGGDIGIHVCVCVCVCVCLCMYVCMYVCIYIDLYKLMCPNMS